MSRSNLFSLKYSAPIDSHRTLRINLSQDAADMAKAKTATTKSKDTVANLGFEAKLWLTADKLRNNMDAAEYKHVVLGLIFLKYISDAFEERHRMRRANRVLYHNHSVNSQLSLTTFLSS